MLFNWCTWTVFTLDFAAQVIARSCTRVETLPFKQILIYRKEGLTCIRQPVYKKTGWRTVFLFQSSKSRQVSLDRLFPGPYLRQEDRTGLKHRKQNLWHVLRQDRLPWQEPVLLENLSQNLFSVFFLSCSIFLSEKRPWKNFFRENCLDFRNKKPVRQPVFLLTGWWGQTFC